MNEFAFDKGSVRSTDRDGRLHVEVTNISKAAVNPYLGREIPDSDALGLEPGKVYNLLRDPKELAKAADTFNNLPLLSQHKPVNAEDYAPELVVGATGSDAVFEAPYLKNSIVVWSQEAIDGIESGEAKELSCAYRYRADMTPGTYQGEPYDGRMVDLVGNHVALVTAGRAGPDVVVGDSLPKEIQTMSKPKAPSRMAVLARGALLALSPVLAADQKLDLNSILNGVTRANWKERKPVILAAITPKLAQDIDPHHVVKLLDSLDEDPDKDGATLPPEVSGEAGKPAPDDNLGEDDDDADPMSDADADASMDAVDADPCAEILEMLRGKLSPEDLAAVEAKLRAALAPAPAADADPDAVSADPEPTAANAPPAGGGPVHTPGTPAAPGTSTTPKEDKPMNVTKPAMDAAIKAARIAAVADGRKLARQIAEAELTVKPLVGEIVAQDSAEAVYKAALDLLGVNVAGVHPSAYRAIVLAQRPARSGGTARVAQDAKTTEVVEARFPNLARLKVLG